MYIPALPVTGLAGWRLLERTETAQRDALARSPEIARDTAYFRERIGDVRSTSDLLADRRLLEVALGAYGLESEIDKRALIERVLEGGVSDPTSVANSLRDTRWSDFARDFGFGDPGSGGAIGAFRASVELAFRPPVARPDDRPDASAFLAGLADVDSVDDLLARPDVLDTAMRLFGVERGYYTDEHFRDLLSGGVGVGSYAFDLGGGWLSMAQAFRGLGDGASSASVSPFRRDVEVAFSARGGVTVSQTVADASAEAISNDDITYFRTAIETLTDGAALTADARAFKVAKVAYGLGADTADAGAVAAALDAARAGDLGPAEALGDPAWARLAADFAAGLAAPEAERPKPWDVAFAVAVTERGWDRPLSEPEPSPSVDEAELAYFRERIDTIESAEAFVADERLLAVALAAFEIDADAFSPSLLQSILEEDPAAPESFVNTIDDPRLTDFVKAFRADAAAEPSPAVWRYEIENRLIANGAPEADLAYLRSAFDIVETSLDFAIDPKLMDITLSAFGIEKGQYGSSLVIEALISDPRDPLGFVRSLGDQRLIEMAETIGEFSVFGGKTRREGFADDVLARFEARSFEAAIGGVDQTLRLALNFRREIGAIAESASVDDAGWFRIIGSEPLRQVVVGALGLPSQLSRIPVDQQKLVLERASQRVFGSSSPRVFADPSVLASALDRFVGSQASAGFAASAPGYAASTLLSQTLALARGTDRRA